MRTFEVSHRDNDLPRDGHRVSLVGRSRTLRWPPLCPNCGSAASDRIRIGKVFRRKTRRSPWRYRVRGLDVPFCGGCAGRHRQLLEPPRTFDGWLAVLKSPLLIPLAGSCITAVLIFRSAGDMMDDPAGRRIGLLIFAALAAAAVSSIVGAWRANRPYRVPRPTEISRAFDFSDNLGTIVTGERRTFVIRNRAFAEAFTAANGHRLWTDAIRERDRRRTTVFSVCVLLAILAAWLVTKLGGGA